jgi:phospholipase/lecithinase/hemolysin
MPQVDRLRHITRLRPINLALALLVAATLAACGGSDRPARFSGQIVFGDSLSDVGTYAVGGVAALGGGKYTINGDNTALNAALTGKNWTELMALQLGLTAPCAAQTGLDGDASLGFSVAVVDHPGCLSYAQGSARVSDPVGPGNKLTGSPLGLLTVPVTVQVQRHLALANDRFGADQAVFMLAGANDVFIQLASLAGGAITPDQAVAAMAAAGDELAALVMSQIVGKGADHVIVINLPEIASTPFGLAQTAQTQQLIAAMTNAFNVRLQAGLDTEAKVLLVDLFARSRDQAAHPAQYGLTNVSAPACDLSPAKNALASSLVCNAGNLIATDVSHYAFADTLHPTPYNYALLSNLVATKMAEKGWPTSGSN